MQSKCCSKCGSIKTIDNFFRHKQTKDGYGSQCKKCKNLSTRKYCKGVKYKAYRKKQYNENKEYYIQYNKPYLEKSLTKYPPGVYGIFENGICLYVGESIKPQQRIIQHKNWVNNEETANKYSSVPELYNKLRKHSHLIFGILEFTDNHKEKEKYYINRLNPKYNGYK